MSNILSIDWGSKYVGLAYADEDRQIPMPLDRLNNDGSIIFNIASIIQKKNIIKIIVGYPTQNDYIQNRIDNFISELSMVVPDTEIIKMDEDYTSIEAKAVLWTTEKQYDTDIVASMKILERYLNR